MADVLVLQKFFLLIGNRIRFFTGFQILFPSNVPWNGPPGIGGTA